MLERLIPWMNANSNAHSGALVKKTPAQVAAAFKITKEAAYMFLLQLVSSGHAKQYRATTSDRMNDGFSTVKATAPA